MGFEAHCRGLEEMSQTAVENLLLTLMTKDKCCGKKQDKLLGSQTLWKCHVFYKEFCKNSQRQKEKF